MLKLLGEGGMGFVFLAEDTVLQRPVALKVMRPEVAAKATSKDRFLREGRAAAKLKNDHIVSIYFVGEANSVPYMALEFLEGSTLDDFLKKKNNAAQPLPVVLKVARDVLKGLAEAHEKGLVHRDIKPANLWIEARTSRVKVLDFGLTRDAGGQDQVTQDGAVVGTPTYMAPEQAGGKPVDGRTDLFSLGVVLHRMVSGKSPFQRGEVMATLMALAIDEPPTIASIAPTIPPPVSDFVVRLLSKDPANRPANAKAALTELLAIEKSLKGVVTSGPMPVVVSAPVVAVPLPESTEVANPWNDIDASVTAETPPAPVAAAAEATPTRRRSKTLLLTGLGGLLAAVLVAVVVITIRNKDGSVTKIKVPDGAKVEVTLGGKTTTLAGSPVDPELPSATVTPPAEDAKQQQAEWAAKLKLPVESTNGIGMKLVLIPPGEGFEKPFLMGKYEVT